MIHWHRLFGMTLTDFFTDTAYTVELEKDLSLKQQQLDVVIIEKGEGAPPPKQSHPAYPSTAGAAGSVPSSTNCSGNTNWKE